ncbi:MAG: GGDEF domain-containing protein [Nitrospiria bacterium]
MVLLKRDRLFFVGIEFGVLFWVVGAVIDVAFFKGYGSFVESLFFPGPMELWMRSFVIVLFALFGFYAQCSVKKQERIQAELNDYKEKLEKLVAVRTKQIQIKNESLENEITERKKAEKKLEALATTDPLTSIYNRRKFLEFLEYEIKRIQRYKNNLSLVMFDIDHFKEVNDLYGHTVGDEVLKTFASQIAKQVRKTDVFARWGGEEFVILLTNSDIEGATIFSDHLRKMVEGYPFETVKRLSMSVGVTQFRDGEDAESLLNRADEALYDAKQKGRNCVVGA